MSSPALSRTFGTFIRNLLFVLALVGALALATTARGDEPNPRGIDLARCQSAPLAATCLNLLLTFRCEQYAFPVTGLSAGCVSAAGRFVQTLDLKIVPVTLPTETGEDREFDLKLIFTQELEALLRDEKARTFLDDLEYDLRKAIRSRISFSLWDYTLAATEGDFERALRYLAVFLQDTSWTQLPVKYFEAQALQEPNAREFTPEEWRAIQKLKALLSTLDPAALAANDDARGVRLYPAANLDRELNRSIYHFYPMAYQAARLAKARSRFAAFTPFSFNTEYEFQDLDPARWPLRHPARFEANATHLHRLQDIYLGLAGAEFGAKRSLAGLPSFSEFSRELARNPFRSMQTRFLRAAF